MSVSFEPGHDIDTDRQSVAFAAVVDGQWAFCIVPFDALRQCFRAKETGDFGALLEENRGELEEIARRLILSDGVNPDQETLLSAEVISRTRVALSRSAEIAP